MTTTDPYAVVSNGRDLNPYSTAGARHAFRLGYYGLPIKYAYPDVYERGQAVRRQAAGMPCLAELTRMKAPRKVLDAGAECDKYHQANLRPPGELVSIIRSWVFKEQDRYGK